MKTIAKKGYNKTAKQVQKRAIKKRAAKTNLRTKFIQWTMMEKSDYQGL